MCSISTNVLTPSQSGRTYNVPFGFANSGNAVAYNVNVIDCIIAKSQGKYYSGKLTQFFAKPITIGIGQCMQQEIGINFGTNDETDSAFILAKISWESSKGSRFSIKRIYVFISDNTSIALYNRTDNIALFNLIKSIKL